MSRNDTGTIFSNARLVAVVDHELGADVMLDAIQSAQADGYADYLAGVSTVPAALAHEPLLVHGWQRGASLAAAAARC